MAGKRHLCKNAKGVGVNRDGAFAEYLVIPSDSVVKLEPNISLDICAYFDPLGNAIHTALKFDLVGEDVIITGAGPIGIRAAAVCRHCGEKNIVIIDVNEYRLALGKKLTPDVITVNVANETAFNTMIDHMDNGAKIALLGIHSGKTVIDWDKVVFNGLTIQGIYGRKMFEAWYKMMSMLKTGLNVDDIITHRFHFTEFEKGFEVMNAGNAGKVILDWTKIEK